jgi:hypothetical protein
LLTRSDSIDAVTALGHHVFGATGSHPAGGTGGDGDGDTGRTAPCADYTPPPAHADGHAHARLVGRGRLRHANLARPARPAKCATGRQRRLKWQRRRPRPFQIVACPGPARISAITRNGVWWLIDGSATTDSFAYWKVELSADGASWTTLYRSETPVAGGRLMEFNTTTVKKGAYQLRLVVVKQDGNYPEPCVLAVTV